MTSRPLERFLAVEGTRRFYPWRHRYSTLVAAATFLLIFAGGLVTSTGSSLSVPDWPLSYGQLFPPMVGGVLYEHGHRMVAGTVALLTFALAVWTWREEPRPAVRRLGAVAVCAIFLQAALGGVTVLLRLPTAVSVAHAALAQMFFCLVVALALVTGRSWLEPRSSVRADPSLAALATSTAGVVYLQLLLGAVMRHTGAGLAIPDFPLAFGRLVPDLSSTAVLIHFTHRVGAVAVTAMVLATAARALRAHRDDPDLGRPAFLLLALLATQLSLGAAVIWTHKSVLPTTSHVAVGAAILATSVVLALRARRHGVAGESWVESLAPERASA